MRHSRVLSQCETKQMRCGTYKTSPSLAVDCSCSFYHIVEIPVFEDVFYSKFYSRILWIGIYSSIVSCIRCISLAFRWKSHRTRNWMKMRSQNSFITLCYRVSKLHISLSVFLFSTEYTLLIHSCPQTWCMTLASHMRVKITTTIFRCKLYFNFEIFGD